MKSIITLQILIIYLSLVLIFLQFHIIFQKMKAFTINQLLKACLEQQKKGNGNKRILISGDDEGNSYHELFYLFSPDIKGEDIDDCLPYGVSTKEFNDKYIVLG